MPHGGQVGEGLPGEPADEAGQLVVGRHAEDAEELGERVAGGARGDQRERGVDRQRREHEVAAAAGGTRRDPPGEADGELRQRPGHDGGRATAANPWSCRDLLLAFVFDAIAAST